MRIKLLSFTIIPIVIIMSFSALAGAAPVPWVTEEYTGYATTSGIYGGSQTNSGSSPPLSAVSGAINLNASSSISDTQMNTYEYLNMTDERAYAEASFVGTYVASDPAFNFIYSLDYTRDAWIECCSGFKYSSWLRIADLTDSITLYNNNSLLLSSNAVTIGSNTTIGHTISVEFGISSEISNRVDIRTYGDQSLTLNYSTAIAPEPISSVLFVVGGTLLAGRRYIKRKKKA